MSDLCCKHNLTDATFSTWRTKYRGLSASIMYKLRALYEENQRLKRLLAEPMLDNAALKDALFFPGIAFTQLQPSR